MDTIAPPKLTNSEKASCILVVFVVFVDNFAMSPNKAHNLVIYFEVFVDNFVVSSNRAHNLSFLFFGLGLPCGEEACQDGRQGHPRGDEEETEGSREVTQRNYKVGNFILRYL